MKTESIKNKKENKSKKIDLWKMSKIRLIHKINTLELDKEVLEDYIKDELFIRFMKKLGEPDREQSLIRENKRLSEKNKYYKNRVLELEEALKNGNSGKAKRTRKKV